MEEQRYVVEVKLPVPPDKVEQVSQRIAARLNVPQERIFTLLDGRVGAVTKPVLADKADAICEVFNEAGVRVHVIAAPTEVPRYVEQFGQPDSQQDDQPAEQVEFPQDEQPEPDFHEPAADPDETPPWHEPTAWGVDTSEADTWRRADEDENNADPEFRSDYDEPEPYFDFSTDQHEDQHEFQAERQPEESASHPLFGFSDASSDDQNAEDYETVYEYDTTEVYVYSDEDPEDEADRLGPSTHRLRVEYQQKPENTVPPTNTDEPAPSDRYESQPPSSRQTSSFPSDYAASTRWTPSPHDPYAFTPEDSPNFSGKRATPAGPAHTTPLTAPTPVPRTDANREGIGGFYSPDYTKQPSDGPHLRTYLLWALAISLVVLIGLQFVFASRVDGAVAVGAFEAGLLAYRKGDFGAARQMWEPLADSGNTQAQFYMGFMLQNGLGQPWSNARAATWYRRAAQQGHTKAQLALGGLYLTGMGVEEDARIGASLYASAAVAGDPEGQFEYAKLLLHGVGVTKDMHGALAWFEAAANNGVSAAADYVEYARTIAVSQ